jgi:hypothetical protein
MTAGQVWTAADLVVWLMRVPQVIHCLINLLLPSAMRPKEIAICSFPQGCLLTEGSLLIPELPDNLLQLGRGLLQRSIFQEILLDSWTAEVLDQESKIVRSEVRPHGQNLWQKPGVQATTGPLDCQRSVLGFCQTLPEVTIKMLH